MEQPSFERLFCERFGCLSTQYENRVFRELLYGRAKIVAPVLRGLKSNCFAEDLKFIRYLGQATDLQEANACIADFQDSNNVSRNFWRSRVKIRMSGRKATELARQLFTRQDKPKNRKEGLH